MTNYFADGTLASTFVPPLSKEDYIKYQVGIARHNNNSQEVKRIIEDIDIPVGSNEGSDNDNALIMPKPIDRIITFKRGYICPFIYEHSDVCTHPLAAPLSLQTEWIQQYIDKAVKGGPKEGRWIKLPACTIEDAKKCPFLEAMPLIDFKQRELGLKRINKSAHAQSGILV